MFGGLVGEHSSLESLTASIPQRGKKNLAMIAAIGNFLEVHPNQLKPITSLPPTTEKRVVALVTE